jgi:hypothetical protein
MSTSPQISVGFEPTNSVIARSPQGDEAIQILQCRLLDFFAALAMTTQPDRNVL